MIIGIDDSKKTENHLKHRESNHLMWVQVQINTVVDYKEIEMDYFILIFYTNKYMELGEEEWSILSRLFGLWWLSYHKLSYHQFICALYREIY